MKRIGLLLLLVVLTADSVWGENQVLSLDGDGDYVSSNSTDLNIADDLTISAWIKPYSFVDWPGIVTNLQDNGAEESGYGLFYYPDANGIMWWISTQDSAPNNYASFPNVSVDLDQWTHLAGTYSSASGEMKLYKNGALVGSKGITGNINWDYAPDDCRLGNYHDDNEDYFLNGVIDEVRIWNIARTESEIQAQMDSTLTGNENGLVGYWNFDDGTAKDITVNGNDGEFKGDAKVVDSDLALGVSIPDPNLRAALEKALGKNEGDAITKEDLAGLKALNHYGLTNKIADLTGLEHCTSLTELTLMENQITNLSELTKLTKLTKLNLSTR